MSEPGELRRLTSAELAEKVVSLRHQLFVLKMQHSQKQCPKPAQIRSVRRDLSRALTTIAEKRREEAKK